MKVDMVMPQMGESITEATILKWRKKVGDVVAQDETLLEISTDKVDSEIPAPAAGRIVEIIAEEGQTVAVKSVVARIETEAGAAASKSAPTPAAPKVSEQQAAPKASPAPTIDSQVGDKFLSPLVRSLASQHGLSASELASIQGTGTAGRISKDDVLSFVQNRGRGTTSAPAQASKESLPQAAPRPEYGADGVKVESMDRMRKLIADHMVRSKATSPHVYSVAEVDVTNIATAREKNQSAFLKREGFKLSFTPFFLEAVTRALVQYPYVNASIDGDSIVLKRDVHLGCAVALGTSGLIVPVIKNADRMNLVGIARSLNDLAERARTKKLKPDETQGGTFTVTNAGVFGSIFGLPIINQPQLAILSVGAIKKRPVVIDDMIAIRSMVYLTISYDHRLIDGSLAGQFLKFVTTYLENWDATQPIV